MFALLPVRSPARRCHCRASCRFARQCSPRVACVGRAAVRTATSLWRWSQVLVRELSFSMAALVFSPRRALLCCLCVPLHGGVIASLAEVARQCSPRVSRAVSECGLHQSGCHGICEYVWPYSSLRRFGSEVVRASQRVRRRCDADPQLVSALACLGQRVLLAFLSVHALR